MGCHELCWVLAPGPAAIPHAIVVHAKPEERSVGSVGCQETCPDPPSLDFLCPLASRVSDLMGDGECRGQANVLIDAAASLSLAHPSHGGQTWEMGTWGGAGGSGLCWPALSTLPGAHPCEGQGHPAHCLHRCLKPRGCGYLVCRRAYSCRCRCHSCGRRGGNEEAGLPP